LAAAHGPDGAVWAVTSREVVRVQSAGAAAREDRPGLHVLAFDSKGAAWAVGDPGLVRREPDGRWSRATDRPLGTASCAAVLVDRERTTWAGCQDGLVRVRATGVRNYSLGDGARGRAILPDRSGQLWLASTRGLLRFDGTTLAALPELAAGIPGTGITTL